MHKQFTFILFILVCFCFTAFAQTITNPIVLEPINFDTSIPLRNMEEAALTPTPWQNGIIEVQTIDASNPDTYQRDAVLQLNDGVNSSSTVGVNFDGVGAQGYAPPDVSMDVGPNHIMQMVNVRFQIWDKNGSSLLGPLNLGTIWSGFPGPWATSLNDGDPVVLYDDAADRWVATQFSLPNGGNGPEYLLIAVSQTADPTGAWYRYGFETPNFPDYPHWGVWPDGYYFSANRFAPSFVGTYAGSVERNQMLVGASAQLVLFPLSFATTWSFLPSDWDGASTPPAGASNPFVMAHDNARFGGSDGLDVYEFHVDWVTPSNSTFTGPTALTTSAFGQVDGIPQLGTTNLLDNLSDRLMQRLQYRNFGSHQTMVVCQTINAGSGRAGMRWYEMRNTGSGWTLYQEGTFAPNDGLERWMGSIAMNDNGDIAMGYSVSSSTIHPDIRYTGRLNGDPLGVMTVAEDLIYAGSGSQTGGLSRWGDYTQIAVDTDGQTFWYSNEYIPYNGSFNWKTRIASFTLGAPCPIDVPTNPNPADGTAGVSINLSELSWTNGSGTSQVELWFGKVGNVSMVYDGAVINNWSIPNTLDYISTYQWYVVNKNDTCGLSGPTWSFSTEASTNPVLFADDFDSYVAGQQVACQNPTDWTTWDFSPCNATTDPLVSTTFSFNSPNSVKIVANNDLVHVIGALTSGKYSLSFQMYVPGGSQGYWNTLMDFAGSGSIWGLEVYYNAGGLGSVNAGGTAAASFSYSYNTWIHNEAIIDLDADWAQLFIGGNLIHEWQWSLGSGGTGGINQLSATDFYGDAGMLYYFDDYVVSNLNVVPVELTSFSANDNNGQVILNWTTATELNNQMFEIERRSESSQYLTIGYVDGHGTTTEQQNYNFVDNSEISGTYFYRLKQIDFGGRHEYSEEIHVDVTGPLAFELGQNYPNPFNPGTVIKYSIPENGFVTLDVYNLLGEKVASLVNKVQEAGRYQINFDASNLASGIYVYNLKSGSFNSVKKMLLMK